MDDSKGLVRELNALAQSVAPTVLVFQAATPSLLLKPSGATRLVFWMHYGLEADLMKQVGYSSKREYVPLSPKVSPEKFPPFEADLGGGIHCRVPQVIYADAKRTLPVATRKLGDLDYDDQDRRLAIAAELWNVPQHFYPYFDVIKTPWSSKLSEALWMAAKAPDEHTFYHGLERMVAALQDGHASLYWQDHRDTSMPGVALDWIQGQVVVTAVAEKLRKSLRPGMVLSIPVHRTISGIEAGLDEQLEKAIEVVARHG
ncbi:MAG TPA: hypothetical protein V6C82_06750 [Chroococcales cyanobacterium]